MDWDVLIPILMFAFPVVVAILDKRAKKRRGVPPVQSRPVFPPVQSQPLFPTAAQDSGARPAKRPTASDPSQPVGWAPPSYDHEGGTVSSGRLPNPASDSEGQRAISRERHKEVVTEEKNPEPKLRIDKKNLILYSEILKPKFDA